VFSWNIKILVVGLKGPVAKMNDSESAVSSGVPSEQLGESWALQGMLRWRYELSWQSRCEEKTTCAVVQ
jgi:hypothetical protein